MTRVTILTISLAGLLVCYSPSNQAFDGKRHAEICQLTLQNLTQQTISVIEKALSEKNKLAPTELAQQFKQACRWPDTIKQSWRYRQTRAWHYLNVERHQSRISSDVCRDKKCITEQLANHWQALEQGATKGIVEYKDLAFVTHFVADLHQPLHVSYGDDAGGNQRTIWWQPPLMQRPMQTNLHSYWDGQLLDQKPQSQISMHSTRPAEQTNCSRFCPTQYPSDLLAKQNLIQNWANQSLLITQQIYRDLDRVQDNNGHQHDNQQKTLPATLNRKWRNILQRQQTIAVLRLTWLLNNLAQQSE